MTGQRLAVAPPGVPVLDTRVPALVLKIGQYPVHSGGVGVIRTLGRAGVPVFAVTEPGLPPAAASRYCTDRIIWRATGREDPADLIPGLLAAAERIGRESVAVALDDEAAILLAEHAAGLAGSFLFAQVPGWLPRKLASKTGLAQLCRAAGIPGPASQTPGSARELAALAVTATFPVVVKNAEPWRRRRFAAVRGTTVLHHPAELLALAGSLPQDQPPGLLVQEYLPPEHSQDWFTHLYRGADGSCHALFTGRKIRSWPPGTGVTACGHAIANPGLAALTERFCAEIGFCGIADLDWRLDLRDGQYKLVDFNPRVGNQFRLFETDAGIDVVRAMHLDLTGRPVPAGGQARPRRIIVEHADIPAVVACRLAGRRGDATGGRPAADGAEPVQTEYAWLASDDPFPFVVMIWHSLRTALGVLRRRLRGRLGRRSGICR